MYKLNEKEKKQIKLYVYFGREDGTYSEARYLLRYLDGRRLYRKLLNAQLEWELQLITAEYAEKVKQEMLDEQQYPWRY
tara:strand:- start:249 stop:485 length:237 start_codon:yes stop_codon:yes gene_type:complete